MIFYSKFTIGLFYFSYRSIFFYTEYFIIIFIIHNPDIIINVLLKSINLREMVMIILTLYFDPGHSFSLIESIISVKSIVMPLNFDKHAQKGNQFLKELAAEFGDGANTRRAGR